MTYLTNDQYIGLAKLERWYRKYQHQIIEVSGVLGTGVFELVQKFLELVGFDAREVMYLSYDQKQVLELAARRYHAYYTNGIIYKYTRLVDFNSLPVINDKSTKLEYQWKKEIRSKIDSRYKIMVVFDSSLLNSDTVSDLASFGLPIILMRDPMMFPAPDSYTFMRKANIELHDLHPELLSNPIVYFANKALANDKLKPGNYDNVSIIPRKQMNLYNLRSSNMILTLSEGIRNQINKVYREKIMKQRTITTSANERIIIMSDMYAHKIVNPDEKKIKIYMTKGVVGNISRINRHAIGTRYVPFEFRPEFYHEVFDDLVLDRYYLNKITNQSRQMIPDEFVLADYAYALTPQLARLSHWDKVTLIADSDDVLDDELQTMLMYNAISRARRSLTILL